MICWYRCCKRLTSSACTPQAILDGPRLAGLPGPTHHNGREVTARAEHERTPRKARPLHSGIRRFLMRPASTMDISISAIPILFKRQPHQSSCPPGSVLGHITAVRFMRPSPMFHFSGHRSGLLCAMCRHSVPTSSLFISASASGSCPGSPTLSAEPL